MNISTEEQKPANMPALVLAYLGDAVFELYVRKYLVSCGYTKVDFLHKQAVRFVNASTQAKVLHALEGKLSEEEAAVVRRGRNAKSGRVPKNMSMVDYRYGTAFESLIGYLFLSGQEKRIEEMLQTACNILFFDEENNHEGKTY